MPEPLAIYGAANTSYGLAKELYGYLEKWATAKGKAKTIQIRFKWTSVQAKIFVDFFKDHEKKLAPELSESVVLATQRLTNSLEEVKAKVRSYDPDKWYRLVQWPWVVDNLEAAEKALFEWVDRLSILFQSLPSDLKDTMRKYILNSQDWGKAYPVAALLEHIEMIKKRDAVGGTDRAVLLATMQRKEPQNKPEDQIYYWKDLIVVPEDVRQNDKDFRDFKVEIAKLAEVLGAARSDITYVPQAFGWFQKAPNEFGIAYKIPRTIEKMPEDEEGHPLRNLTYTLKDLVRRDAEHMLDERLSLAIQIASAVAFLHSLEWVHKSLRSDNIMLGYDRNELQPFKGLGRVYLRGFNVARRGTSDVRSTGAPRLDEINWRSQVYVHPQRQLLNLEVEEGQFYDALQSIDVDLPEGAPTGLTPAAAIYEPSDLQALPKREFFKYKHDIYSLGVILLELGLWQDITGVGSELEKLNPTERMQHLRELAKASLGLRIGQRYLNVVTACLNVDESHWDGRRVLDELYEIRL